MSQTKVKSGLLNFPDQTDFVKLPSGNTAQRPSSPEKGYSRYNTTDNKLEYWNGTVWQQLPGVVAPTIESVSYPGDDLAADPAGGQTITLTGTNFLDGATVEIEGTLAPVVTVVSKTEITFTAPAKTAGDYNILLTNGDNTTATFIDGITYNGLPSWTTPAGNLGSFPAGSTIPTITLVATEPDSGVVSYSVTTGALPAGLVLTGADIDGTVPSPAGQTTYNFSVTASDDENQESTERAFNIVVYLQVTNTVDEVDPFGDSSGIALYKLDGDATDESGVNNGFSVTSITWGGVGVFGSSASFPGGTSAKIGIPDIINSHSTTISAWVKGSGYWCTPQKEIYAPLGTSSLYWGASGTDTALSGIEDGNWHHIAVCATSARTVDYYVDGVQVAHNVSATDFPQNYNYSDNWIGHFYHPSSAQSFNGLIDQFRIFNRGLTSLEVESLYRERTVICGGQADTLDILGDNSCIATYQLNGNANDLSGNYSGTPTNVSYGVGEFDLAGVFNGSSSYIKLNSLTTNNTSDYTFSFWCRNVVAPSSGYDLFITATVNDYIYLAVNPSGQLVYYFDNYLDPVYPRSAVALTTTGIDLSTSEWKHIVFRIELTTGVKIYVNNVEVLNYAQPSTLRRSVYEGNSAVIGAGGGLGYAFFNGEIDQVRIFNKALSSSEVTTLYNETACDALACSGTTNTLDILSDGSCIAAYPLDGSPVDLSGNYNGVQTDVTYPVGKFDLGASFNGSTSAINTIYTPTVANLRTISLWFKCNVNQFQVLTSVGPYGVSNNYSWVSIYMLADGKIGGGYAANNGGSVYLKTTTAPYNDNSWHHLALTLNGVYGPGSFVQLYIDGVEVSTTLDTAYSTSLSSIQGTFRIGHSRLGNINSNAYNVNGSIDQVRIFNKALSAAEVTTLYNETACN